jgi:hypothetical protein
MKRHLISKSTTVSLGCRGLTAGAVLCALSAPAASAVAPTPPPPELAPLLQKTGELEISSERFSGELALTGKKVPPKLKALGGLKVKIAGEESSSPQTAAITETTLGKTISIRLVANAVYIRDASLAKHDGGRPWVKETVPDASSGLFGSHTTLGSGSGAGAGGSSGGATTASSKFKTVIALLKASNDVRALGASTVAGQAVSGFAGTADPKEIEESSLPAKLRAEIVKSRIKPAATFEVFIAANGLPVRSQIVLALGGVKLNVTEEVPAINFPVAAVTAPPAAETISAAELKKTLAKAKKKKNT